MLISEKSQLLSYTKTLFVITFTSALLPSCAGLFGEKVGNCHFLAKNDYKDADDFSWMPPFWFQ